jgi:molecular chaperone GrpE
MMGRKRVKGRRHTEETPMSSKQTDPLETPVEATSAPTDEAAEPIVVKDRRFWGKKAQAKPNDPQQPEVVPTVEDPTALREEIDQQRETIAALQKSLHDKDSRLNATVSQYKDALEEFENIKGRLRRDVAKDVAAGKRQILTGLLEVMDNLERALEAAQSNAQKSSLFDGVVMVRDQFKARLLALGVTRVDILGKPFDPAHFEAISTVPVPTEAQHDTVMGVVRDAYLMGEETLRHGIVAVGKFMAS